MSANLFKFQEILIRRIYFQILKITILYFENN